MFRRFSFLSLFAATMLCFAACTEEGPDSPWGDNPQQGGGGSDIEQPDDPTVKKEPEVANNNVVAHRGGVREFANTPDNSLASLRNAISLGCYGSELDIYWTKDDNVIVAHADSQCRINNLYPWDHTVDQLRRGGSLSNGEQLPTLEEYIKVAMTEGKCTKLILDIKNITAPSSIDSSVRANYCIKACKRSVEIAKQMGAEAWIEFICTGNETVMKGSYPYCMAAGIPIAWMANRSATEYIRLGYTNWANLSLEHMNDGLDSPETGNRTIEEFTSKGLLFSVYNVDTDAQMNYYLRRAEELKCISTNYPKEVLTRLGKL